ncbi:hypothetical protein FH972_012053 [Carpinus fangiana]|uniref:Uncharacterized protein n=1 Tax=Carpinus fangiana TaxID=176857 RepID=A0A5N6R4Z0_9ROSI|nr:hypothetical protein FH972_012053 [Carpinus fangiana]
MHSGKIWAEAHLKCQETGVDGKEGSQRVPFKDERESTIMRRKLLGKNGCFGFPLTGVHGGEAARTSPQCSLRTAAAPAKCGLIARSKFTLRESLRGGVQSLKLSESDRQAGKCWFIEREMSLRIA